MKLLGPHELLRQLRDIDRTTKPQHRAAVRRLAQRYILIGVILLFAAAVYLEYGPEWVGGVLLLWAVLCFGVGSWTRWRVR
jgi:uncharacterized membrane protein YdbT with pleckstrin-like domain